MMKGDIGDAFEKLKQEVFVKYKGCLIDIIGTGYYWNGVRYNSLTLAKERIDQEFKSLGESITK